MAIPFALTYQLLSHCFQCHQFEVNSQLVRPKLLKQRDRTFLVRQFTPVIDKNNKNQAKNAENRTNADLIEQFKKCPQKMKEKPVEPLTINISLQSLNSQDFQLIGQQKQMISQIQTDIQTLIAKIQNQYTNNDK